MFKVIAVGTITAYHWYKDGQKLTDNADISGATQTQLNISNVKASDKGTYYCEINGKCNTAISDTVQLDITSKVIDLADAGITISPNPAHDQIEIYSTGAEIEKIEILNSIGKRLMLRNDNFNTIDISSLIPGIYYIKLTKDGKEAVGKLVVE